MFLNFVLEEVMRGVFLNILVINLGLVLGVVYLNMIYGIVFNEFYLGGLMS